MGHEDLHGVSKAFKETVDVAVMALRRDFLDTQVNIALKGLQKQEKSYSKTVFTSSTGGHILFAQSPCKLLETIALTMVSFVL
jgi:hypothetical protein